MVPVLMRDPKIVAALRLLETSVIVTTLAFLGQLQSALSSKAALASFNWSDALVSLELGVAAGLVNALIAYFTALRKSAVPPSAPADTKGP